MYGLLFLAACAGAPLVGMAGLKYLISYRFGAGRWLRRFVLVLAVSTGLLFPGGWLLGQVGLAWRSLPGGLLAAAAVLSGAAAALAVLACTWEQVDSRRLDRWLVTLCAGLIAFCLLSFGPVLAVLAFGGEERVLRREGEAFVEVNDGFIDPSYHYYQYHGPLVRGSGSLGWDREPWQGEAIK